MSNSIAYVANRKPWIAANKPLAWACLPMLAVLIVIIGLSIYEATEKHRFQTRIRQMRSEGIPVDRPSLVAMTRAKTRPEGTMAWSEISVIEKTLSQLRHDSPRRGTYPEEHELQRALFLGKESSRDERATRHLEKLRPLFKSVEQGVEFPAPVIQQRFIDPYVRMRFDEVSRDLVLELMHALYHRQVERATVAMDLMFRVDDVQKPSIESDDWGFDSYWGKRNEYKAISCSLNVALWDEPTIRKLIERLQPERALSQRWRATVDRNRALAIDGLQYYADRLESDFQRSDGPGRGLIRFLPVPRTFMTASVKNWLLDGCEEQEWAADEGYSRLYARAAVINVKYFEGRRNEANSVVYFPHEFQRIGNESWSHIKHENHRRLTRTALAVKLFEKTKGRWPKNLGELSEIDFSSGETHTVQGERLGYEVDGESAFVWLHQVSFPISSSTPEGRYPIVANLKAMKVPLEEIDASELVRIR